MFNSEDPPENRPPLESLADYEHAHGLVIQTPVGISPGLRKFRAVLLDLGICEDVFVLAALGEILETASVDPLHLCRMVRDGLLKESTLFTYPLKVHGMTAYLEISAECAGTYLMGISVVTNTISFLHVKDVPKDVDGTLSYADSLFAIEPSRLMLTLAHMQEADGDLSAAEALKRVLIDAAEKALTIGQSP